MTCNMSTLLQKLLNKLKLKTYQKYLKLQRINLQQHRKIANIKETYDNCILLINYYHASLHKYELKNGE